MIDKEREAEAAAKKKAEKPLYVPFSDAKIPYSEKFHGIDEEWFSTFICLCFGGPIGWILLAVKAAELIRKAYDSYDECLRAEADYSQRKSIKESYREWKMKRISGELTMSKDTIREKEVNPADPNPEPLKKRHWWQNKLDYETSNRWENRLDWEDQQRENHRMLPPPPDPPEPETEEEGIHMR